MPIKVIINGAKGKMGQLAVTAVAKDPELSCVASCDRGDDLAVAIQQYQADVVVDFTNAHSVFENTKTIIENHASAVIGSSGLNQEQVSSLQALALAHNVGGVIAPNFSLGAVYMMQFAKIAAQQFNHVEIIEYHHNRKQDAPSGTATRTAELIALARNPDAMTEDATQVENAKGARGGRIDEIPVHAVRLPGFMAHQSVIFGNMGEHLTIRHDSIDRACFMPGVCLACRESIHLSELVYGLENIIPSLKTLL